MPNLFVIAGPNGAGKSTTQPKLLSGGRRVDMFVNADDISAEIAKAGATSPDVRAGRIMLERLDGLVARQSDFAFETTLSSLTLFARIEAARAQGYLFHLIYLWLPSADMAVERVAARVRAGGHGIPEATIRRRYERSLDNFFNRYRPIADSWLMLDNSTAPEPKAIAWRNVGGPLHIVRGSPWDNLRHAHERDPLA